MSGNANPRKKSTEPKQGLNGVLVQLQPGENEGDRKLVAQALGDVKGTEVPTLLRLAAKNVEDALGIS